MKKKIFFGFMLFLIFAFPLLSQGKTAAEIIETQKEEYGISGLKAPEAAESNAKEFGELTVENVGDFLDAKKLVWYACNTFFVAFSTKSVLLIKLFAMLALMWVVNTVSAKENIIKILSYITTIISALILFEVIFSSAGSLVDCLSELMVFIGSLIPVLAVSISASGFNATAVTTSGTMLLLIQVLTFILSSCVIPCVNMYLALGVGGSLTQNLNLKKLSASIRNITIGIMSFILCIFSGIMSAQTLISVAGDSITRRTLRFAAGSYIPVAGGSIAESIDTVFACGGILKSSVGVFGIVTVFFMIMVPISDIAVNLIILTLANAFCSFFGNETLGNFFSVTKDAFAILLTVACSIGVMIILTLTIMVKCV